MGDVQSSCIPSTTTAKVGVGDVADYESKVNTNKTLSNAKKAQVLSGDASIHQWFLGPVGTAEYYQYRFPGLLEMITIRTKWLDDAILSAIKAKHTVDGNTGGTKLTKQQLVIVKAGLDTRGFRLPLAENKVHLFEIDELAVMEEKLQKLIHASRQDETRHIAKRLASKKISFVDSIKPHGLARNAAYSWEKPSTVVLEDIAPYVSKERIQDQVLKIAKVVPKGSTLLLTYADKYCFENPSHVGNPTIVQKVMKDANKLPWITGYTPLEMKELLDECGFDVEWDSNAAECRDMYCDDVDQNTSDATNNRPHERERQEQMLCMERFVMAKKRDELIPW